MMVALDLNAQTSLPPLKFEQGSALISGSIHYDKPVYGLTLVVAVKNIFKEQPDFYSTSVQPDGSFSLTIPLMTNNAFGSIIFKNESDYYPPGSLIGLSQTKDTHINAMLKDGKVNTSISGGLNLTEGDRLGYPEAISRFDTAQGELSGVGNTFYDMPLTEYVTYQCDSIFPKRINYAMENISLSPGMRTFLIDALRIHWASGRMFFYKEDAKRRFNRIVQEPPLSYYSFLRDLNLNPETALYETNYYPEFMKRFLKVAAFGISPIADLPINTWIQNTKIKVEKTIGTQGQSFYDVLALYAYLNDNILLSAYQKQNISTYYIREKKGMGTALLKHYALMDSIHNRNHSDLRFNITPNVNDQTLLDTILSRYPGKTVLIDVWGTWCQPCIIAHKAMSAIKDDLKKRGVVFVYLADTSSPKQLWRDKAQEIGDEHYYLTRKQVSTIFRRFKEDSYPYPFYLIFDKTHKLKQKFSGFPGVERIKQALTEK